MLKTKLSVSIYLDSQVPEIVDALWPKFKKMYTHEGLEQTVRDILNGAKCVGYDAKNDNVVILPYNTCTTFSASDDFTYYFGCRAISALLSAYVLDPKVETYDEIEIPVEVYYECDAAHWADICFMFATVINRDNRCRKMHELNAPYIIQVNEERMLREQLDRLENNSDHPVVRPNGIPRRTLADIGYSLRTGWCDDMLAYFEERDEETRKEMEEAMQEQLSNDETAGEEPVDENEGVDNDE